MLERKKVISLVIIVILGCFISRLFFIQTNVFFFDGDEAIVGLMALDILNGELPIYFYGQQYGLAVLEAGLISLSILTFGTSSFAIKIAMLCLWTSSIVLLTLIFLKILKGHLRLTILFAAILIISPTWLVWSMKARGGYLTSFFFSSLVLFLLFYLENYKRHVHWFLIGVLCVFIYESQPLWLPSTLFIAIYFLYLQGKINLVWRLSSFFIGFTAVFIPLHLYKKQLFQAWTTPTLNLILRLKDISHLPNVLLDSLGGNYFLSTVYDPKNKIFALCFLLLFIAFAYQSVSLLIKQKKLHVSYILLMCTLSSLFGFFIKAEPRYLLPFYGFAVLFMVSSFAQKKFENE